MKKEEKTKKDQDSSEKEKSKLTKDVAAKAAEKELHSESGTTPMAPALDTIKEES
jgi:hypothetical protein